jgi:hypothetical protein
MYYGPFLERFPEVAAQETRVITAQGHALLPDGEYGLVEFFCTEPGCDCRRVMFSIYQPGKKSPWRPSAMAGRAPTSMPDGLAQMIRTSSAKCKAPT